MSYCRYWGTSFQGASSPRWLPILAAAGRLHILRPAWRHVLNHHLMEIMTEIQLTIEKYEPRRAPNVCSRKCSNCIVHH